MWAACVSALFAWIYAFRQTGYGLKLARILEELGDSVEVTEVEEEIARHGETFAFVHVVLGCPQPTQAHLRLWLDEHLKRIQKRECGPLHNGDDVR